MTLYAVLCLMGTLSSSDKTLKIWDLKTGSCLHTLHTFFLLDAVLYLMGTPRPSVGVKIRP